MTLHCDHCRGKLGVLVHRYWHMRFCSAACLQAYEARLLDETRAKIHRLDCGAASKAPHPLFPSRASGADHGVARHFAG